jgi:hypothetical protein
MAHAMRLMALAAILGVTGLASSQDVSATTPLNQSLFSLPSDMLIPGVDPQNKLGWTFVRHLALDQKQFWLKPLNLTRDDKRSLFPFVAISGMLMGSDNWITRQVPDQPDQVRRSQDISDYAVYSLVGAAGSAFLWGHLSHNDLMREAGLLSGEAAVNATTATYALKIVSQRPRPEQGGGFFQGGNSFPSEHSAIAWSVASVMAHEYPRPLSQFLAYGLASAVTIARVTSSQHYASDAFVGSALGWYMGRQVYRSHHDPDLGGGPWGGLNLLGEISLPRPDSMGSAYVPLDSWVYPQLERLAALGALQSGFSNMRPWTRLECARLVEEATERIGPEGADGGLARQIYEELALEFLPERRTLDGGSNLSARVDTIYSRATSISGTPLRDGYHFGQTIINDYGRPYAEGWNSISGVSAQASAGPVWFSFQGEYQHAPAAPSYSSALQQAIASVDSTLPATDGTTTLDRLALINAAVGLTFKGVNVSFGRQSTWLGPTDSGSMLFSNNAPAIDMLRIDSVSPYHIPFFSKVLGPARSEFFIGQLAGQQWVFANTHLVGPQIDPQPFIHGTKVSFKPTPNLEFGMGITAMFGGPGLPFTWGNFVRTYYSHKTSIAENPGKRFSAFDFSYRVPGLRNWLTFYLDSLVVDEISPIGSDRPSLNVGLYMPKLPKFSRLELRVEGMNTSHHTHIFGPGFVYYDRRFRSGYTSEGRLIGNAVGRDGNGIQAWGTYSFSPRNRVQFQYRHVEVDRDLLRGGHLNDFAVRSNWMMRPGLNISAFLQYERWAFPLLDPQPQSNFTTSLQLTCSPNMATVAHKLQSWKASTIRP